MFMMIEFFLNIAPNILQLNVDSNCLPLRTPIGYILSYLLNKDYLSFLLLVLFSDITFAWYVYI